MDELQYLASVAGIHLPYGVQVQQYIAQDAQPTLVTAPNGGIPAWLANYFDPKLIDVIVAPMKAALILGEQKKGDFTTDTATFVTIEPTGETSAYGDHNENGSTGINPTFPQRQSFHYQTMSQWGEREVMQAGVAGIDYVNRINQASILTLNKYQNKTYFYGVAGLQNYGLLNDPALPASIAATDPWNDAATDGGAVYEDIRRLFVQLQIQCNGTIDAETEMVLGLSPTIAVALNKTNQYNVNVTDQLKKNFPNLTVITAPEYGLVDGDPLAPDELVQLIAKNIDGQVTGTCAFTEKLRAHPIIVGASNWKQKKSQGSFGAVIFRPFAIASMTGV